GIRDGHVTGVQTCALPIYSGGPSPTELLLVGLGGCTGMDVIALLRKMRQDVTAYRVEVHGARRDEHPQIFTEITVVHVVGGRDLDPRSVARAGDLSATRYCPASAMPSARSAISASTASRPRPSAASTRRCAATPTVGSTSCPAARPTRITSAATWIAIRRTGSSVRISAEPSPLRPASGFAMQLTVSF